MPPEIKAIIKDNAKCIAGICRNKLTMIATKQTIEPTAKKLPNFVKSRSGFIAMTDKPKKIAPVAPSDIMINSAPFENVVK